MPYFMNLKIVGDIHVISQLNTGKHCFCIGEWIKEYDAPKSVNLLFLSKCFAHYEIFLLLI